MERNDIRLIIGRNIHHRRRLSGLSRQTLADRLGATPRQIGSIESGHRSITCDKLISLAAIFGCSVDDLCG